MRTGFRMYRDVIASGLGEGLEIGVGRRDHQMRIEDLLGVRPQRLDDVGSIRDVRNKVSIHHVEMDPVGAGGIDRAHFLAELREIRGQDRGRDDQGT